MQEYKQDLREFISRALRGEPVADDEDIFESGAVNSLFAMELVTFVETTYGIEVINEDLELENFSSVDRLAEFVARKKGSEPSQAAS